MKLERQSDSILVLSGVPGGVGFVVVALAFGAAVAAVSAFGLRWALSPPWGWNSLAALPWCFGLLLGIGFLCFGAGSLLAEERLTLDKAAAAGVYEFRSRLPGVRQRRLEFAFDRIRAVSLEHRLESSGGGRGMPRPALRARLLLDRQGKLKRDAIELDDTQNGREQRVRELAGHVADFLAKPLAEGPRPEPP